jgi:hypothetical protein
MQPARSQLTIPVTVPPILRSEVALAPSGLEQLPVLVPEPLTIDQVKAELARAAAELRRQRSELAALTRGSWDARKDGRLQRLARGLERHGRTTCATSFMLF